MLFLDCSGLTTISRYPIKNITFDVFDDQGALCDRDFQYFGRKGIGHIQIQPMPNLMVYLSLNFLFISRINMIFNKLQNNFLHQSILLFISD